MNKRAKKNEKLQRMYEVMEPLRVAKKETIHYLAGIGKKHKMFKYPILIGLFVFIFIYNLLFHAMVRFKVQERFAKVVSVAMTVVLIVTSVDLTALAFTEGEQEATQPVGYYTIAAVEGVEGYVEVPYGTTIENVSLPKEIEVTLDHYAPMQLPVASAEPTAEPEVTEAPAEPTAEPEATEAPVEPTAEPEATETPVEPTAEPEATEAPVEPTAEPEATEAPVEPTAEPETTETPVEPTAEPETTEAPAEPTAEPEATEAPAEPTAAPETPVAPSPVVEEVVSEETQTVILEPVNAQAEETIVAEVLVQEPEVTPVVEATPAPEVTPVTETSSEPEETQAPISNAVIGYVEEIYIDTCKTQFALTWECDNYDGNTPGEYIFTAQLQSLYNGLPIQESTQNSLMVTVKVLEPFAFTATTMVEDIEVQLSAQAGVFPEGSVLSVEKIVDQASLQKINESVQAAVEERAKEMDDTGMVQTTIAFDIKVLDAQGIEIQPYIPEGMDASTAVQVTFKQIVPQISRPEDEVNVDQIMEVYYVEDSMETATAMETAVTEDSLSFSPEHFSTYVCTCWEGSWKSVSSWSDLYKAVYNKTGTINVRLKKNIYIESMFLKWDSYALRLDDGQKVNLDLYGYDLWSEEDHSYIVDLNYKSTLNLHNTKGNGWIRGDDYSYAVQVRGGSTFNMYGGSIYQGGGASEGVRVYGNGTVNIYRGRIYGFTYGIYSPYSDSATITMKSYDGDCGYIDQCKYGIYLGGSNKTVAISKGEITNSTYAGIYNPYASSTISFTGGKITGKSGYRTYGIYSPNGGTVSVGGNVNFSNNSYGDVYIKGVKQADYNNETSTGLLSISSALNGTKVGIRTYYAPTQVEEEDGTTTTIPVVVASAVTGKDKLYNSTNSSYGVYQPAGASYLVTGPMDNSRVNVSIVKEGLYTPETIEEGKVAGKIAWGTEALSTSNISKVVKFNAEVSLTAMVEDTDNYVFDGWYIGNEKASSDLNYTFAATGNVDVKAKFKKKTFKVTASAISSMATASITSYKLPDGTSVSVPSNGVFEVGSELVLTTTAQLYDEITTANIELPSGASEELKANYPYTRYYDFVQWNDGFTAMTWTVKKDNPGTSPDYNITGTRTVTVTQDIAYVAQYKLPAPDPYATGMIFIGVKERGEEAINSTLEKYNPIETEDRIILIGWDPTQPKPNMGDGSSELLAVAGLPSNHALGQVGNYTSTHFSGAMENGTQKYSPKDWDSHKSTDYNTLINTQGVAFTVEGDGNKPGDDFDPCPNGEAHYSTQCGYWHFWCSGGAVKGGGPYLLYTYDTSKKFKASNVSATLKELVYNDTPNPETHKKEVKSITMDVKFSFDENDDGETDLVYTLANITWIDDDVCFSDGDRVVQLDLNGVLFTKILPEAMVNGVEYATLAQALAVASEGDTVFVQGDALTKFANDITVPNNVTIKSFDGSTLAVTTGSKVNAETDGTIVLINGTITATPPTGQDVTVDVNASGKEASVTADKPVIVTTQDGGKVTTTETMTDIVISPDGDPSHTVTYVGKSDGIPSGTEYGLSSGELTVEEKVVISEGTEYDLKVDLGGTDQVIKTESTNTGDTTISKGQDASGNNTIVIDSEKKNNNVTVGSGEGAKEYITSEDGTKLVITQGNENVGLMQGSVSVPQGGQIQLPSGQVIENSSNGTGDRITVSADNEGNENISIPSGSKATINGVDVSVPPVAAGEAENLPANVTVNQNGNVEVSGKPGNQVTIGGQNYTIGDYDATIEVSQDRDGDGKPETIVTEGSIVLAPGQSITDSNGVTYTNPAGNKGNMQLTMTPGQNTSVEVAPGESFNYETANGNTGSHTNPSDSADVSFSVSPGGSVSLDSEVALRGPNNIEMDTENGKVNIVVPSGNNMPVVIDPVGGSVTLNQAGDKVTINGTQYESTQGGTMLVPGPGGVNLVEGGVKLDGNKTPKESVIVNGTDITNTGSGQIGVEIGDKGKATVNVPQGGGFTMGDDESDTTVSFSNPGQATDYIINQRGELEVGANSSLTFNQGNVSTTIKPGAGGATVTPTEDGVQITVPKGGSIVIDGVEYTNSESGENARDLVIVVDPSGKPVIKGGTASVPAGEEIYLQDGTKITNKGDANSGNVTVNSNGKVTAAQGGEVGFTTNGKESTYEAKDGSIELTMNPETGKPVQTGGNGNVQLGAGSSLEVITDTKDGASTGEANETELDQEQKLTITNNSSNTGATPIVDRDGNVTVPENGNVTIKSESVKEDGSITTTTNNIQVPSGSENVTLQPKTDGSVGVEFGNTAAGDGSYSSGVIFNGKELTTHTPGTKLTLSETGASLEKGSIELDPDETISVNGSGFTNTGSTGSKVNVEKAADGTTNVEVSAGGSFEMFVPGKENTAVEFTNPSTTGEATYGVDSDGNIKLSDGKEISFDFPGGAQGVKVSGAPGAEGTAGDDVSLKVTEDGVKITAGTGNDIKVNDTVFENTGNGDLAITVEPDGTPKLDAGSTILPAGKTIKLPNGEKIQVQGGDIQIDANGNITVPQGTTSDVTVKVTDKNGKTHTYVIPAPETEGGTASDVKLQVNQSENATTDVPILTQGATKLPAGSQVAINNGDTIFTAAGTGGTTIDANGNMNLPAGSGVKVDSSITDGENKINTSYEITTPTGNDGEVNAAPNATTGGYDITVNNAGDTVKVKGTVGSETFVTEFTTTTEDTQLSVSENGTTLESGGVVLDGNKTPKESVIVNGTGVTNTGSANISVNKTVNGQQNETNLTVGAGGKFELFDPENPGSAVEFTNPSTSGEANYTVKPDGSIVLGSGDEISFTTADGPMKVAGNGVSMKVTQTGSVEMNVPANGTVTINGKTYSNNSTTGGLKLIVDEDGNVIIASGSAEVPAGESVYVQDSNGNKTEIKKNVASSSNQTGSIIVNANGNVDASAGDVLNIGGGIYESKDESGEFDVTVNPATGETVIRTGDSLDVTNGETVIRTGDSLDVSISSTGNKTIGIERGVDGAKPSVTIPSGGNATIDNGNDGSGVEILVPTTTGDKNVTMNADGNLSVTLAPGEQITIAGVIYTADPDGTEDTTLTINGNTGSLIQSSSSVGAEIDPDGFDKPNYSYDVPSGGTVVIDGVTYEAPEGGMTLIGNPGGKPIIKVNEAGQSVTIGGKDYMVGSDDTQFIVNGPGNVTLVGDGSSIIVNAPDTMYVDGNKVTTGGSGAATVTKKSDGSNTLTTTGNVQTGVTLGSDTPLNLAGTSATVNGSIYSAPSDGMTLTSNGAGKKPTVQVNKAGTTVQIDGVGYTAGSDNTQFVVNEKNNVTLVGNGSSLTVKNPRSMVIDGNTINATGATTGGYTITKTQGGNNISINNGTKLDVTMGSAGSQITVTENVYYEGRPTDGNTTVLTTDKSGTQIVLDKTSKDGSGNYITTLKPSGTTTLTPQKNEEGETIGFAATKPNTPVVPPSGGSNDDDDDDEEELIPTPTPIPTMTPRPSASPMPSAEPDEESIESTEPDTGENETDGQEEPEESKESPQPEQTQAPLVEVRVNDVEETIAIPVSPNMEVSVAEGTITIQTHGDLAITSDVNTFINAVLTDKEITKVKKGEKVEVRFTTQIIEREVANEDKEVLMKAYEQFSTKIDGLQISETYDIIIERRIGDKDWEVVSELKEPIDITVEVPDNLRKEGRTYYLLRNHKGTCMVLEDKDSELYTITVATSDFSVYSIIYTDADVQTVSIADVNKEVAATMKESNNILMWMLVFFAMVGVFATLLLYKKHDE